MPDMTQPVVHAIHENPEWFGVFADAFEAHGVPYREWLLTGGQLDLNEDPPPGVYWSRFSASSHTRGHGDSKEHTLAVLDWAQAAGRRVVNGRRVLELEVSKIAQLTALRAAGIDVPRTRAVVGSGNLLEAARDFDGPFITKHNQGGKGLGVQKFADAAELAAALDRGEYPEPVDGVSLLQEYITPADGSITRVEIVGGEFLYAVRADTLRGGFQLCPADACAIDPDTGRPMLPPGASIAPEPDTTLFSLREDVDAQLIEAYLRFTRANGIEVAGIEFVQDDSGRVFTYDVNTNTNYNPDVERVAPASGPAAIAEYLGGILASESRGS